MLIGKIWSMSKIILKPFLGMFNAGMVYLEWFLLGIGLIIPYLLQTSVNFLYNKDFKTINKMEKVIHVYLDWRVKDNMFFSETNEKGILEALDDIQRSIDNE